MKSQVFTLTEMRNLTKPKPDEFEKMMIRFASYQQEIHALLVDMADALSSGEIEIDPERKNGAGQLGKAKCNALPEYIKKRAADLAKQREHPQ